MLLLLSGPFTLPIHDIMQQTVCQAGLGVQAIIGNYAVPILEEKQVWGTSDETKTAYLDSQVRHAPQPCVAGRGRLQCYLACTASQGACIDGDPAWNRMWPR